MWSTNTSTAKDLTLEDLTKCIEAAKSKFKVKICPRMYTLVDPRDGQLKLMTETYFYDLIYNRKIQRQRHEGAA